MLENRGEDLNFLPPITEETEFRAKEPIFSYYCQSIIILKDYCFAIFVSLVCSIYFYVKFRRCRSNRNINKLAREIYSDVKKSLAQNINGLSESDILRKYMSYPRTSRDNLPRNEEAFR